MVKNNKNFLLNFIISFIFITCFGLSLSLANKNKKLSNNSKKEEKEEKGKKEDSDSKENSFKSLSSFKIKVEKFKLKNGFTVLLQQDNTVPLVNFGIWFDVGAKNETKGITGISHLIEHLVFNGTKKYPDFFKVCLKNGMECNAATSYDYTGYFAELPSEKLEVILSIEANRLKKFSFTEETLKKELKVIKEEKRRYDQDEPLSALRELTYSIVFKENPYHFPIIGTYNDLNNITSDKIKKYWSEYYHPNNAVIVLVGDIKIGKTKKLLQKYFANIPSKKVPEFNFKKEPEQTRPNSASLSKNINNPSFIVAFQTPPTGTYESYVLDFIANILGDGKSSRLYKKLVYRDQKLSEVYAYNNSMKHKGVFVVVGKVKEQQFLDSSLMTVYTEIWKLRNKKIDDLELIKARNQTIKSYVDTFTTFHGRSHLLAINEVLFSSYKQIYRDYEEYNKITIDDIQEVASKFLIPEKRTVTRLLSSQ